jgi:hypothetical protein
MVSLPLCVVPLSGTEGRFAALSGAGSVCCVLAGAEGCGSTGVVFGAEAAVVVVGAAVLLLVVAGFCVAGADASI